jgi:adenylate kinase family enzyme
MKNFLLTQVGKAPKNKNIIFIGNPRLKPEAQLLNKLLGNLKRDYLTIYLHLSKSQIIQRSRNRVRMHTEHNAQYITNRIKWHKDQVGKTVSYFGKIGKLHKINGNQSITDIRKSIEKIIHDYQKS